MTAAPAGERYGEVPGYYFERRRATFPGVRSAPARVAAGDIVNVIVQARRPAAASSATASRRSDPATDATKKRVLVVAAEDYTGVSPNVTPGYATAPRYLRAARRRPGGAPATRSRLTTSTRRRRTAARSTHRHADQVPDVPRRALALRRRHTTTPGDDFVPQDSTETNPRRIATADDADRLARDGAVGAQGDARAARLRQQGRQAGRRRPQRPPDVHGTSASLSATGPYTWTPDKLFGFYYPANNARRRRPARHGAAALAQHRPTTRGRTTSASIGRQSGVGVTRSTTANNARPGDRRLPGGAKAGGLFAGMAPFAHRQRPRRRPEPGRRRHAAPAAAKSPLRLRNWGADQRAAARRRRIEADYATPITYPTPPAARSSRRVTPSRSASASSRSTRPTRNELVQARHELPAADHGRTPRRRRSSASSTRPSSRPRPRATRSRSS